MGMLEDLEKRLDNEEREQAQQRKLEEAQQAAKEKAKKAEQDNNK